MIHSEQIDQIAKALCAAQAEMKGAIKDSTNPFFNSKYADLESVWEACREPLTKNGLSITQFPTTLEGKPALTSMLMHTSGQWMRDTIPLNPVKNDPQSVGSAITYIRRYSVAGIAGVTQVDDDGNASTQQPKRQPVGGSGAPKSVAKTPTDVKAQIGRTGGYNDYVPPAGVYAGKRLGSVPLSDLIAYREQMNMNFKNEVMPPALMEILAAITGIEKEGK